MASDLGPLPGGVYAEGPMSTADIYPTHSGIGGLTTQDRALPAFADSMKKQATDVRYMGRKQYADWLRGNDDLNKTLAKDLGLLKR